jgi:hypothetical protein
VNGLGFAALICLALLLLGLTLAGSPSTGDVSDE